MKPKFYSEDRDNLTVNEQIELLKALHSDEDWDEESDEFDLPNYYLD